MMKEAGRELGRIDILVNNAANYETADFEKLTTRQWDAIFASNTRGPFLVSREALKWMRRKRGNGPIEAKIINMGSLGEVEAMADSRPLLFIEGRRAHADKSNGQGTGAGDRGERRGPGND